MTINLLSGQPLLRQVQTRFPRSRWGKGVVGLGDVDGDGIPDLAVSAQTAVDIVFMNKDGSARSSYRLLDPLGNFALGSSLTAPGDGDGTPDLIVGASGSSVFLSLQPDGTIAAVDRSSGARTVRSMAVVATASEVNGVQMLALHDTGNQIEIRNVVYSESVLNDSGQDILPYNAFRGSNGEQRPLASVGTLDGIGLVDIAAGIPGFDDAGFDAGAIQIALRTWRGDYETTLIASNTGRAIAPN